MADLKYLSYPGVIFVTSGHKELNNREKIVLLIIRLKSDGIKNNQQNLWETKNTIGSRSSTVKIDVSVG